MLLNILAFLPIVAFGLKFDEARTALQNEVKGYQRTVGVGKTLCETYTCCELENSSCDISTMPQDETTLVLPGGASQCIFDDSTPYAAQVIPGDKDKLLVFFQGGMLYILYLFFIQI